MLIKTATFQISAPALESCPASELMEFAFIGRSNVGKSSLLNMLVGKHGLAKASSTPGHTQLINFFTINEAWTMVDLPGYGYAKTAKGDREKFQRMIGEYLVGRENLAYVFVLIDARHTPQPIDLDFVKWLSEEEVPFVLVFTKTDKLKPTLVKKHIELFQSELVERCVARPEVFTSSAETREGRKELLGFIGQVLADGKG